eukprot:UN26383
MHAYGYASNGTRRGPLRSVIHRRCETKVQRCRYDCDVEDTFLVVMNCKKTKGRHEIIKKICLKQKLVFSKNVRKNAKFSHLRQFFHFYFP